MGGNKEEEPKPVAYMPGNIQLSEECVRSYLSLCVGNKTIATIGPDGKIIFGEGTTPDDAAKAFWAAVEHLNPLREKVEALEKEILRLEELLITVQTGG